VALEEQLGLRLVSARGTRDVLTIDAAELPSGNQVTLSGRRVCGRWLWGP
jgi:hypothetical protein